MGEVLDEVQGSPAAEPASGRGFVIAAVVSVVMLVAIAGTVVAVLLSGPHEPMMSVAPGGAVELSSLSDDLAEHYLAAARNPDVYAGVPCFCGCEATLEHRSLLDCFVRPAGGWERHASGCAVCVNESRIVRSMLADGTGVGAIRAEIVATYSMDA